MRKAIAIMILFLCAFSLAAEDGYVVHSDFTLSTEKESPKTADSKPEETFRQKAERGALNGRFLLNIGADTYFASLDTDNTDAGFSTDKINVGISVSVIPKAKTFSLGVEFAALIPTKDKDEVVTSPSIYNYYIGPLASLMIPIAPDYMYFYLEASAGAGVWHNPEASSFDFIEQLYFGAMADLGFYFILPSHMNIPVIFRFGASGAWLDSKLLFGMDAVISIPLDLF